MMNERLKYLIADEQSYIRLRMLFFLTAIPLVALLGAAAEYRLHRHSLDELGREPDFLDSTPPSHGDTMECPNSHSLPLSLSATLLSGCDMDSRIGCDNK